MCNKCANPILTFSAIKTSSLRKRCENFAFQRCPSGRSILTLPKFLDSPYKIYDVEIQFAMEKFGYRRLGLSRDLFSKQ